MPSIRINAEIRDTLVENLLRHKFVEQQLELDQLNSEITLLREKRDSQGYETAFDKATRDRIEKLPEGWLPVCKYAHVAVEREGEDQSVERVNFGESKPVPYKFSTAVYSTNITRIVSGDEPYFHTCREVDALQEKIYQVGRELSEQKKAVKQQILAIVNSVTTVGRLLEIWPDCADFLPEVVSGVGGGVPANLIENLNAQLGLNKAD